MEKNKDLDHPNVPGVVIDYIPAETKRYIGSPSIAILPNGHYIASHDVFGPGSTRNRTRIFCSEDAGKTWHHLTDIEGQWWSNLFMHNESLYIMGTSRHSGYVVIRRSTDGGKTWTEPKDKNAGLLAADGRYHTAPVTVVVHEGRIWRAMEDRSEKVKCMRAFVMSAPVEADLLKADNWSLSNRLPFGTLNGWREGNIVITPQKKLVNILRVNEGVREVAAVVRVSEDGKTLSFDPDRDLIDFYGGGAKFTIRYDGLSSRYWSLVNEQPAPDVYRNILALTSSPDLRNWKVERIILRHADSGNHAFQYVDWLFEGDDIIAVSRTAWDGSHKAHDANYMTFHRIHDFRELKGN